MKVAIIPARGGSQRIPRKNIKAFCGKPIIAWSVEAAMESGCFDKVIVSTDDPGIAEIAQKYGAETPFIRPDELADEHTGTVAVVNHAIDWLERHRTVPELVCCIYATAPFIQGADIKQGLEILQKTGADFTFSVTSYAFPIQRAIRLNNENRVEMINPKFFDTRSQDLEETYHDAGQFYWGKKSAWLKNNMMFSPKSAPVILPRHRVQDIDTLEDWKRAELMFKVLLLEEERLKKNT